MPLWEVRGKRAKVYVTKWIILPLEIPKVIRPDGQILLKCLLGIYFYLQIIAQQMWDFSYPF